MFIRSAPLRLCRPTWGHITWATTLMLLGAASAAQPSGADAAAADTAVLAVVEVPKPGYAPRFMVTRKMRETIPQYASIPGLAFKAYAINRDGSAYGGLYLWDSLGEASAWFSPDWFERVSRERGTDATVRFFKVISVVDTVPGGTPPDPRSNAVASLLLLPTDSVFADASPQALAGLVAADQHAAGLLRRYRVLDHEGRMGVLSLWQDAGAARLLMTADMEAEAEWFDTPILLPRTRPSNPTFRHGEGEPAQ